ncbi:metal ABC transporter substrate-binding protein [bacterium]|nr:metal ABC transporter substrate-binding protein [bacterium]
MFKQIIKLLILFSWFLLLSNTFLYAAGKVEVVTTSGDLADLTEEIGGDRVKVVSLSRGEQDLHYVEPRPSMVIKLKNADLLVKIGMDLDIWVDSLINASRNSGIVYGAKGYVDASVGIMRLGVPSIKLDASMGHLHIYGNPHYLIGPQNIPVVLENILKGLVRVSPGDAEYFRKNKNEYLSKFNRALSEWEKQMAPFKGFKIVTYHKSWEYFAHYFGLEIMGNLEPKPGIPPSPSHLDSLIERMKTEKAGLIIQETFHPKRTGEMVARETGAEFLVLPASVGAMGTKNYFELFDYIVKEICSSLK